MTTDRQPKTRSKAFKLGVLLLAPILGLLAIEGGFRVRAHQRNNRTLDEVKEVEASDPSRGTRLVDIIQPNSNDKIIYDLRPNLDTTFKDRPLKTNSAGFRGPERALEAAPGELTIVGIGASMMFGHGVGDGEEYAPLLEHALNEQYPARKWRFINTSAPSYNVVMKVETLIEKGLAYKPDLVLLNIAGNNLDLPQYIRVRHDPLDLNRSFLFDFFRDRSERKKVGEQRIAEMAWVDRERITWDSGAATNPEEIPEQYRDLVGWAPFRVALDELRDLSKKHNFEVIMFVFIEHDLVPAMLEEGRQRGFHIISLMKDLDDHLRKRTGKGWAVESYTKSDLVVSSSNLHPSPVQHRMAMERILQDMKSFGIVDRLLAR